MDEQKEKRKIVKELAALLGNKTQFTEEDFEKFIIYSPVFFDENLLWWAWQPDKSCWQLVDETTITNLFGEFHHLPLLGRVKYSGLILKALKLKSRQSKPKELPPYCIQFKNKIYNLQTQEEFLATPKYFLTSPIDYELSDSDETPIIDKLFNEWVGSEHKQELYEVLAYSCLKEQFMQVIIALIGIGSNGKGTFLNLIKKFVGVENCVASNFKSLINRSFETSALYKKLICLIGEVDASDLTNTNLLKGMTGEDLIRYEFKGKTPFSESSPTTFLIATNSLPLSPDKSDGFYRRWHIIDFPNQFGIKRDLLAQIPEQEFCNLTRKVVNTLISLMQQQEFTNAGNVESRRQRYEERSNPLIIFISDLYDETGAGFVKLREFTNAYNSYLKTKKLRQVNVHRVGWLLRAEGFEISPRKYQDCDGKSIQSAKSIIGITPKILCHLEKNSSLGSQENDNTTQTTENYHPVNKIPPETGGIAQVRGGSRNMKK